MSEPKTFVLINPRIRNNAILAVNDAPPGYLVTIKERTRSSEQNAKLHAMLSEISKSGVKFAGKPRSVDEWKAIMVSGHSVATGHGGEVIPGLEGEFVAIRESTASMGVSRAASLIEYIEAFCAGENIPLTETRKGGFYDEAAA